MRFWAASALIVLAMPTLETCAGSQIQQAMHPTETAECGAISACGTKSPHLKFTITPDHGPRGTLVTLTATGCNDPHRDSHALSYNAVADLQLNTMQTHQRYPRAMAGIPSTLTGTTLVGTFQVRYTPRKTGVFFAQCSATVGEQTFRVTP